MDTKYEGEWHPFPINENVSELLQNAAINIPVQIVEERPCAGGHKVDGKTPMLNDIHLDQKTCDCGRMKYIVEGCGCQGRSRELHGHPNQ